MHLAQELLINLQGSGGSRSFAKKTRTLKIRSIVTSHQKLTMANWEQSLKLLLLHEKLLKNPMSNILWSFGIWSKVERWKSSISGQPQIKQKKKTFWSVVLSYVKKTNHFSIRLWSAIKSGFNMTTGDDQLSFSGLRRNSKELPKAKLAPKKVMITVWWSAASLIHYSFLNPRKTITCEK